MPEPMDYYEEYSEWLMATMPEECGTKERLIAAFESCKGFEQFLAERHPEAER
jgi:hypothetical protein